MVGGRNGFRGLSSPETTFLVSLYVRTANSGGAPGGACFEIYETMFRYSWCVRKGSKAEEKWKTKGLGIWFGGERNDEHRFSSKMWADKDIFTKYFE